MILVLTVPSDKKDSWERLDIILKGIGAIATPVAVCARGVMVQRHREATENDVKEREIKIRQFEAAQKLGPTRQYIRGDTRSPYS